MLAYVFWHWPNEQIDRTSYCELLEAFHETLRKSAPPGFLNSVVLSVSSVPGEATSQSGFEDWYLVEDSSSLDVINHAAVSGACEQPHNLVARQAAGGTAGLYRLRAGEEALGDATQTVWFSKPPGVSYEDLYKTLAAITSQDCVGLWQRQMTLGPTTEFGLYSRKEIQLPESIPTKRVQVAPVWPRRVN